MGLSLVRLRWRRATRIELVPNATATTSATRYPVLAQRTKAGHPPVGPPASLTMVPRDLDTARITFAGTAKQRKTRDVAKYDKYTTLAEALGRALPGLVGSRMTSRITGAPPDLILANSQSDRVGGRLKDGPDGPEGGCQAPSGGTRHNGGAHAGDRGRDHGAAPTLRSPDTAGWIPHGSTAIG